MKPYTDTSCRDTAALCSIDWLALSAHRLDLEYSFVPDSIPSDWVIAELTGTAVWSQRHVIHSRSGVKLATVLFAPKSRLIGSLRAVVEVANPVLYSSSLDYVVETIGNIYLLKIDGISRVDICIDYVMTARRWVTWSSLANGTAYAGRYRQGSCFWSSSEIGRTPHCLSWGAKTAQLKWKGYWKFKELMDEGGRGYKDYIWRMWEAASLPVEYVWRHEVSLMDCNRFVIDEVNPLDFKYLQSNYESIFWDLYGSNFVIRKNEGHKDRRNDTVLDLLVAKWVRHRLNYRRPTYHREVADSEVRLMRFAYEQLLLPDNQGTLNGSRLANLLQDLLQDIDLMNVFMSNYGLDAAAIDALLQSAMC